MKKAPRTATGRGGGRGARRGAGRPARQPTFGRVRGAWLPVALASSTRPEEGTSRTRRCVGRGLRGRRAIHQVSRGVPQRRFALRAKFPFVLCYWVDVCVSADPAKLSWLRRLPTDVPVEPRSPARRASLPRSRPGQQGAGGAEPPGRPPAPPLSPRAEAAAVSCLSVSVCGDRLLFFLYLLSGWGAAWVPVDPTISGPPAVAKRVCPAGPPPSKTSRAPAEWQRGHEPRGHLVCVRTCTWPSAVSGPRALEREDTWASSGQNRLTDRPWRRERFLSAPCPVATCHHGAP